MTYSDGVRVRLFAVESSEYPGGINYRFHAFDADTGTGYLRYDNSQVPTHGAGCHHRHEWIDGVERVDERDFVDLDTHLDRFETEVTTNVR